MRKINIAIDGPSAAGKSTISKQLAKKLGYVHLDSGAMYRCTAFMALKQNLALDDEEAIVKMLNSIQIALTSDGRVLIDDIDVTSQIRTEEISMAASTISKLQGVRTLLVSQQQSMAKNKGYIMDGRDIGTVVLKDAEVKIYMTASSLARAKRRYLQDLESGIEVCLETLQEEIEKRDYQDMHRAISPLCKAEDAIEIDTSNMTIEEVVNEIYSIVKDVLNEEVIV